METRWRTKKLRLLVRCAVVCLALTITYGVYSFWPMVISGEGVFGKSDKEIGKGEEQKEEKLILSEGRQTRRKTIYDRNFQKLAVSFFVSSVYVKPLELIKKEEAVSELSLILDLNEKKLKTSLASERGFTWLAKNIDLELGDAIKNMDLAGVYTEEEEVRYYPNGENASHLIGFAKGEQGLAGVESYYNDILLGDILSDSIQLTKAGIDYSESLGNDGVSLVLSLDMQIQVYLEKKLSELVKKMQARSGMALVMVSETGEILALANNPSFDSNIFWKTDSFERRNRVLTESIKAGALLNIFRIAAELEQGNIPGFILDQEEIAKKVIEPRYLKKVISDRVRKLTNSNWKELADGIYWPVPEYKIDFVVSESSLSDFAQRYGLKDECDIDLPCRKPEHNRQEVFNLADLQSSTTSLQLLTSFNRLINGNKAIAPHVLKSLWLEQQDKKIAASFVSNAPSVNQDLGNNVIKLLSALSPLAVQKEIFIETLVAENDFGPGPELMFSNEPGELSNAFDHEEDQESKLFEDVMLSAVPFHAPEVSMVMVIDGATINFGSSSISRPYVNEIMSKALKVYRSMAEKKHPINKPLPDKELFPKWSKYRDNSDRVHVSAKHKSQKMPLVKNFSLRKALQSLQKYNLQITVVGSGKVKLQHPLPGTLITDTTNCTLELNAGNFQ